MKIWNITTCDSQDFLIFMHGRKAPFDGFKNISFEINKNFLIVGIESSISEQKRQTNDKIRGR
jgi:hypothetical protein